jgi:hypothetical protein
MTLTLGQVYDSGLDTSGVTVNQNPTVPTGVTLDSLPLNSGAGSILPSVVAIPCPTGQTCSYFANVPDWVLWLGVAAAVIVPLMLTKGAR